MVKLFLEVLPITCLVGGIYAIYRCVKIKRQNYSVAWGTEIIRWLFVCYLTGLVNLILVPSNLWSAIWFWVRNGYSGGHDLYLFSGSFNFVPSIFKCLAGELILGRWVKEMLVGNLLMFMPMGLFLPFVSKKVNTKSIIKFAIVIPFVIEIIQPVVGRSFDIDDLICNFLGIVLGCFVAAIVMHLTNVKLH